MKEGILDPKDTDVDTNYKMNPPLRTKEDVEALKEGLKSGIMEVISTDHAPHTFDDKKFKTQKKHFELWLIQNGFSIQNIKIEKTQSYPVR